ncbi:hypothetical protein [Methylobacterium sp. WL8]|uniref:hypothetical protein n=1 Tax=Methylobacterium sp. WL8 TaxID=2603899 RepID=UPI00164F788C
MVDGPGFSSLGGSRFTLAFGCGESIGSSWVVSVALPSSAGMGGSAVVFGFGAASAEARAAADTISRFVMLENTLFEAGGECSRPAPSVFQRHRTGVVAAKLVAEA